jgi:UDPglucose--hexose-1-phosphate uridylyltransferase
MDAGPTWQLDPLTDRWVIRAPSRARRPRRTSGAATGGCPFCPGNEAATPPQLARWPADGDWRVRVFPNLYPAVDGTDEGPSRPEVGAPATGVHEVIVTTASHDASFADLDDEAAALAMTGMVARVRHHLDAGRAYAQAFINHGAAAGASIDHPHGQLIALDRVPPRVAAEVATLHDAPCALCRPTLVIAEQDGLVVWAPEWSEGPYELLVAARAHDVRLGTDPHLLGTVVRDTLRALRDALGDVAYNVVLHPSADGRIGHPHVHVTPRTTTLGGFELGTGVMINPVAPESAAAALREAW